MLALALADDGVMRWSAWGLCAAGGLMLCSAVSALVLPRRGKPIRGADGTSTFVSPGFALVTVAGAVGSLPDLVRLVTGRLHRWRVVIDGGSITYRDYRTDETWPVSKVHGAGFNPPRPVRRASLTVAPGR